MTEKISSILFVTFSIRNQGKRTSINGMIEPMISFFTPLTKKFILIEQPHPGSDTVIPFLDCTAEINLADPSEATKYLSLANKT